jgi:hypothetical protein
MNFLTLLLKGGGRPLSGSALELHERLAFGRLQPPISENTVKIQILERYWNDIGKMIKTTVFRLVSSYASCLPLITHCHHLEE